MNIPFVDLQLQQHREDTLNGLRLPNQRVQPVRQNEEADIYAQMVKKLNDKPSVKEILLAYTHG